MAAPTPDLNLVINLLTLPLKKHPLARNATADAKNLHIECLDAGRDATLGIATRCKGCLKILEKTEIIKGFAEPDGSVTRVTEIEMKALAAETNKAMELIGFFPENTADHKWFGQADLLGPVTDMGLKLYLLLYKKMRDMKIGALVKYRGRGRDKVGIILAGVEALVLFDCYFPAEQRTYAEQFKVQLRPLTFSPQEETLITQLINSALIEFEPAMAAQKDEYWERVEALLSARRNGLELPAFETPLAPAPGDDLVAALTASINMRPTRAFETPTAPSKPPAKVEPAKPEAKAKRKRA